MRMSQAATTATPGKRSFLGIRVTLTKSQCASPSLRTSAAICRQQPAAPVRFADRHQRPVKRHSLQCNRLRAAPRPLAIRHRPAWRGAGATNCMREAAITRQRRNPFSRWRRQPGNPRQLRSLTSCPSTRYALPSHARTAQLYTSSKWGRQSGRLPPATASIYSKVLDINHLSDTSILHPGDKLIIRLGEDKLRRPRLPCRARIKFSGRVVMG